MLTVNLGEAKKRWEELIEKAAAGESFIIAKAGKPMVTVTALSESDKASLEQPEALFRLGQKTND